VLQVEILQLFHELDLFVRAQWRIASPMTITNDVFYGVNGQKGTLAMTSLPTQTCLTRRSLMGGAIATSIPTATTLFVPGWAVAAQPSLNLTNNKDLMTAIMKIRGSTDNNLVFGYLIGNYYGVVNNRIKPLFGLLASVFSRYHKIDDYTYGSASFEVAYFTDWDTGELLETFNNPYTGELVDVPQTRMGPSSGIYTTKGRLFDAENPVLVGREISHRFLPLRVQNNSVWLVEETSVGTPEGAPGTSFVYNEVTTRETTLSDLNDPTQASAPISVHFTGIVTWRPWLKMGGHPGHMHGDGTGRRVNGWDDMPPKYVELTKIHHPDVYKDANGILDQVASSDE